MTTQYPDTTYCQLHEVHYYLGQQCPKCKAPPATGCACGAAVYEAHDRTERCTPVAAISPETRALWAGDAYERGAYIPRLGAGMTPIEELLAHQMEKTRAESDTSGCCYQVPGGCERHRKRAPTPAAMLAPAPRCSQRQPQ